MAEQQNSSTEPKRQKSFLLKLIIPLMVVVALVVGSYFGLNFYAKKSYEEELQAEGFATQLKQLQTKYDQLQSSLQDVQNIIQKSNLTKARNWRPLVIEHLIRMADLTLNTSADIKLALSYLLMAKQYASTSELSMILYALNKDIANLQIVPQVDVTSLALEIESLSQKLNSLPLIVQKFNTNMPAKEGLEPPAIENLWQRFFASTIKALKDIVVIRRQVVEPLLSPEQETILRLNIQTKLLEAELAVIQRQNNLYHACLDAILRLVKHYFVASQILNTDILRVLEELQGINLQPKLPPLTESLTAVQNFLNANKVQEELPMDTQTSLPAKGTNPV